MIHAPIIFQVLLAAFNIYDTASYKGWKVPDILFIRHGLDKKWNCSIPVPRYTVKTKMPKPVGEEYAFKILK